MTRKYSKYEALFREQRESPAAKAPVAPPPASATPLVPGPPARPAEQLTDAELEKLTAPSSK